MRIYSRNDFLYHDGTFIADASDIGFQMAMSIGIRLESGRVVQFDYVECDMSGDDVAGWRFRPRLQGARTRVLIVND